MYLFIERTKTGKAMRAVAQDMEAASVGRSEYIRNREGTIPAPYLLSLKVESENPKEYFGHQWMQGADEGTYDSHGRHR